MVIISQRGYDGFGHQLHGLFTCLTLHKIKNYYFDGVDYMNKKFVFQHLNSKETNDCKQYMIETIKLFNKYNNIQTNKYNKIIHSHEIYNIPINYDENILYTLDNVFFFNKVDLNEDERNKHLQNIKITNTFFFNKKLPNNRLDDNNIVIHFRQGDALTTGRGDSIKYYNTQILNVLDIFFFKYKNYTYYLHTDGDIKIFEDKLKQNNQKYIVYKKNTHILNVLSDLMYSKILICGNSSLSKVCSFINEKELIITNDDNKVSLHDKTYKISDYILKTI
jgi:hypothetical protein